MFRNDNGAYDRFVALYNNELFVGGSADNSGYITIENFPEDANPVQTTKFCVLSIHWNNIGTSGCGKNNRYAYCNGKNNSVYSRICFILLL